MELDPLVVGTPDRRDISKNIRQDRYHFKGRSDIRFAIGDNSSHIIPPARNTIPLLNIKYPPDV